MPIENERNRRYPILAKLWKCCPEVVELISGMFIVHCNAKSTPIIPYKYVKYNYRFSAIIFEATSAKRAMFFPLFLFRRMKKQAID